MPETTSKLFHKLRSRESGKAVLDQERTAPTCAQVLRELLEQTGVSAPEWIAAADISKSYAYQVLRGERIPGRDILLRTALALRLSLKETQRLLADKAYLESLYRQGAEKAAAMANRTLRKVHKKVGFVPR